MVSKMDIVRYTLQEATRGEENDEAVLYLITDEANTRRNTYGG